MRPTGHRSPLAIALGLFAVLTAGCVNPEDDVPTQDSTPSGSTEVVATTTTIAEAPRQLYTVRNGDTLVRIANRFDIDLNALVKENGIANPTRIFVGQQLLIPPPEGEDQGPLLTVPPPTRPNLPPLTPTLTMP